MSHIRLKAKIESLPELSDFINNQCDDNSVLSKDCFSIMLIVEELITNICYYAYPDKDGDFEVDIEFFSDHCLIKITDSGIPFNPTKFQKSDTSSPISERKIGGLGLLLVRENADDFQYERINEQNIVRVVKQLKRTI